MPTTLSANGNEIGGGSIRIHQRDVQERVFKVMGVTQEQADTQFGFLLEGFKYGAPPHGGIALGWDRVLQLLTNSESIRGRHRVPEDRWRLRSADPGSCANYPAAAQGSRHRLQAGEEEG